ncbi:SDR family NAD(P)-dependent oxidoreductase [Actinomadura bangladeshensis]|uniref:SDR family NAD(P)-dependent oxidoreductase n=1 Tax=Actinomadura bangladeshensis TaxID=453573 RepID=A0A4R4PER9_9ACTN|nr:SDR family NAD(P)-dependent oxidoreductase [Actinomadura bangladeshensis]TDC20333.1 SDR family NAD(P)-dependent oxidoreductase [Actinomadura bangladeshensis]
MTQLRFDDRVAVVTGAGHGLGRAYALLLASRGAKVVVNDLGGPPDGSAGASLTPAEEVVREIEQAGGEAVASGHDVSDEQSARAIVQLAVDRFGGVDIVINNAGTNPTAPFVDTPRSVFEKVLAVHLLGAWSVTQAAWPHLVAGGRGRVVNTCSAAMFQGHGLRATYSAAKGALYGLTRDLAVEGGNHGMKVNALCPGALTRMLQSSSKEIRDRMAPWKPEAVANPVAVLAHDSCPVNGETIEARGGEVRRVYVAHTPGIEVAADALTPELVSERFAEIVAAGEKDVIEELVDMRKHT